MQVVLESVRFAVVLDLKNSHHRKSKVFWFWTVYIGIVDGSIPMVSKTLKFLQIYKFSHNCQKTFKFMLHLRYSLKSFLKVSRNSRIMA